MRIGRRSGAVPARAARRRAVHHRHPAAQRHRLAAHRPRARQHAAGHPHPPRADAGQGRAVGGRHRPCRHRHPDGGRAPARRAPGQAHQLQPRGVRRQGLGVEGGKRRPDHPPAAPPRCPLDWANERFTMDEGFSAAVTKVFVELYNEGLLYRDKRLVNWDPKFQTAICDLEVENARGAGPLLALQLSARRRQRRRSRSRPPGPRRCSPTWRSRCIPTTSATALVGKHAKSRSPITGRLVPIVADEHADPELGSGAVKITPGHDFNDFEVGKRRIVSGSSTAARHAQHARCRGAGRGSRGEPARGSRPDPVPEAYRGLDRFEARKRVVD